MKKPKGIGGWLILPTIGLFIAAIVWVFVFIISGLFFLSGEAEVYDLMMLLMAPVLAGLSIFSLFLEFKKKKEFPKWIIVTLWVGVVSTILLSIVDGDYSDNFSVITGSIIWTWYFSVSKRVKNTFIN